MPTTIAAKREVAVASLLTELIGKGTHTTVNGRFTGIISELGKATKLIDQKKMEVGDITGLPIGDVEFGAGDGYLRRYQNGVIYLLPPSSPCWVHGAILNQYLALGADGGWLGYPTTDERTTPDGVGRYNHFERGSIYWTY